MRKARIATVLLLVTVLISGFSCSEGSIDILACVPSVCLLCGTYVSQADSSHYIEIHSDATANLHEGGAQTSGTWYSESILIINWQGNPYATRWEVEAGIIRDDAGIVWVRQ
jgi:hypothetical protein